MHLKYRIVIVAAMLFSFFCSVAMSEPLPDQAIVVTEADCTADKLGSSIPVSGIGELVAGITLKKPVWTDASELMPGYCSVDGSMAPVSKEANAKPINFRVILPASWNQRAAQMGGSGFNGFIPNLLMGVDMFSRTSLISLGFATYGSDSGHQMSGP